MGEFGEVTPDGECEPGAEREVTERCEEGFKAIETCTDGCEWDTTSECVDQCGVYDTDGWDEEICIPAGPFIRGNGDAPINGPQTEIMMSAFLIDRYPATNERYQACIDAGDCTALTMPGSAAALADPDQGTVPVRGLTWYQAEAFCTWAGRRIPSEAMLEKQARGPAPTAPDFPWGDDFDCTVPRSSCPGVDYLEPDPAGTLPGNRGWYGTEDAIGRGPFWASDLYAADYYTQPGTPLTDPEGPTTVEGMEGHSVRFPDRLNPVWVRRVAAVDWPALSRPPHVYADGILVRCARNVEGE